MTENSLFQLAQVITNLPMHQDTPMTDSSPRPNQLHQQLIPRKVKAKVVFVEIPLLIVMVLIFVECLYRMCSLFHMLWRK
jgi:hypothetical protein